MIFKTNQELREEAREKYYRISNEKKKELLERRKRNIIISYSILAGLCFVLGVTLIISAFLNTKSTEQYAIFGAIFEFACAGSLFAMFFRLRRTADKIVIDELQRVLAKTYSSWSYAKLREANMCVEKNSEMYKNITELNARYKFDSNICQRRVFREVLASKKQFDNFSYEKWIDSKMENHFELFKKVKPEYEELSKRYKEYLDKYNSLESYTPEIEVEKWGIDYEYFAHEEHEIFFNLKKPAITSPSVRIEISYRSPSGRNHYYNSYTYEYRDLIRLVEEKIERDELQRKEEEIAKELQLAEKEKKEKLAKEKREKERKLRELEKIEKEVKKKEKELEEKEQEFLEATQGHIYTGDAKAFDEDVNIEIDDTMTLTQKMAVLREKFDNGEITYEEYQKRRRELL